MKEENKRELSKQSIFPEATVFNFSRLPIKGLLNAPFKGVMILSCCGMMRSGELHSLLLMNAACDENALDIDDYHPCEFCFL